MHKRPSKKDTLIGIASVAAMAIVGVGLGLVYLNDPGDSVPNAINAHTVPTHPPLPSVTPSNVTVAEGDWFTVTGAKGQPFTVVLKSVSCGPLAAVSAQPAPPVAPSGSEFCSAVLNATNTGKSNDYWHPYESLYVGGSTYTDDTTDLSVFEYTQEFPYLKELNPNQSSDDTDVFLVPVGSNPTALTLDSSQFQGDTSSTVTVQLTK